jgi:hypothetical protein
LLGLSVYPGSALYLGYTAALAVSGDPWHDAQNNTIAVTCRRTTASKRAGRTSAHLGVPWHAERQRWTGNIQVNGKAKYLTRFKDELAASDAYQAEKARLVTVYPALSCDRPAPDECQGY